MTKQRFHSKALPLAAALMLLVMLSIPCAAPAGPTKQEILKALQQRYLGVNDIAADYTRITTSPAMESFFKAASRHRASGRLMFKKPNQLLLNQLEPRPEKLVTDGVTVWWYIPADNQVQRYSSLDLFAELKPFVDFLAGLANLGDRFTVELTQGEEVPNAIHELVLLPAKRGAGPQKITLWVDVRDYTLVGFRLTSVLKETTDFHLENIQYNQGLSGDRFVLQIPPGTEVIDIESQ